MAPAVDVLNTTLLAGVTFAVPFSAPDFTDAWDLNIFGTIQLNTFIIISNCREERVFQAIAKAFHDLYLNKLKPYAEAYWTEARTFVTEHRTAFIIGGVVLIILAMAYLLPQAFMLFLRALGYTARGIAEGSAAAAYQSARLGGYIAKGSWFAIAQSLAAGGRCFSALPWPFAVLVVILLGAGIVILVMAGEARL